MTIVHEASIWKVNMNIMFKFLALIPNWKLALSVITYLEIYCPVQRLSCCHCVQSKNDPLKCVVPLLTPE